MGTPVFAKVGAGAAAGSVVVAAPPAVTDVAVPIPLDVCTTGIVWGGEDELTTAEVDVDPVGLLTADDDG